MSNYISVAIGTYSFDRSPLINDTATIQNPEVATLTGGCMLNQNEFLEELAGHCKEENRIDFAKKSNDAETALRLLQEAESRIAKLQSAMTEAEYDLGSARHQAAMRISMASKYGIAEIASMLLPIKDCLEQALHIRTNDVSASHEGLELILRQLVKSFDKAELTEINPAGGDAFDPVEHATEAGSVQETSASQVAAVVQKGYRFADRVVRPAIVKIRRYDGGKYDF